MTELTMRTGEEGIEPMRAISVPANVASLLAGCLVVSLLGCSGNTGAVATVRRGSIAATVSALGRAQPSRQITLSTQASGRVAEIAVEVGQEVTVGQVLLQLELSLQADAVAQAERRLALAQRLLEDALDAPTEEAIRLAQAKLRRATAARQNAQDDYDDIADEADAESSDEALDLAVAKLEYEIAQSEFDRLMRGASDTDLERMCVDVQSAELSLRQAEEQLASRRIVAPMDGTVLQVSTHVGENLAGWSPTIRIADLDSLQIVIEVDELDIAQVESGQTVEIRLDAFPGKLIEGELVTLSPGPSSTQGTTAYEGHISFDPRGLTIRPGMGANVTIITQSVEDALLVPRRAVREVGRHKVVRVIEGRTEETVVVTIGLQSDSDLQVLSGLEEGQRVRLD